MHVPAYIIYLVGGGGGYIGTGGASVPGSRVQGAAKLIF